MLTDLVDASALYDWGFPLSLREICGFVMICILATEFFSVAVVEGNKPVMVLPPLVLSVRCWFVTLHAANLAPNTNSVNLLADPSRKRHDR